MYKYCKVINLDPPNQEIHSFLPIDCAQVGAEVEVAFTTESEDSYNDDAQIRARVLEISEKTYSFIEMVYRLL